MGAYLSTPQLTDTTAHQEEVKHEKTETPNEQTKSRDNAKDETIKETTAKKKKRQPVAPKEPKRNDAKQKHHAPEKAPADDHSFVPVKDKSKRGKAKEETPKTLLDQTAVKKSPPKSQPQIIDHYQTKRNKQAVIEPLPVLKKKFTSNLKRVEDYVIVNRLDEKPKFEKQNSKQLVKESKKVTSSISYASIVTNNITTEPERFWETQQELAEGTSCRTTEPESILNSSREESVTDVAQTDAFWGTPRGTESIKLINEPETSVDTSGEEPTTLTEALWVESTTGILQFLTDEDLTASIITEKSSYYSPNNSTENSGTFIVETSTKNTTEDCASSYSPNSSYNFNTFTEEVSNRPADLSTDFYSPVNTADHPNIETSITEVPERTCNISVSTDFYSPVDHTYHPIPRNDTFTVEASKENFNTSVSTDFYSPVDSTSHSNNGYDTINVFDNSAEVEVQYNENKTFEEIQRLIESEINSERETIHEKEVTEETLKFIEEEKCVKKSSYITGDVDKLQVHKMQQIRVLTLQENEHKESTLYRLENNWVLEFRIGPTLFGRKLYLYCNYPIEKSGNLKEFNRATYHLLQWMQDEGCENADDTAAFVQIKLKLSGSFHYYFTFTEEKNAEKQGSGYFLVDPVLRYGEQEELPLNCIQCQTVLAKNLGSFSLWANKLRVAKESGYNMIHFTPIQELGASNSCYSLKEQLKLNPVFKKQSGDMPTFEEIEKFTAKIRKEWKMTSICDIVLNHTANESEWLKIHPEVTYNCSNCPYMRPAYLLDAAFYQFSVDIKNGLYEDKGIPPEINSEDHLNAIRYHFKASILEVLKLEELFICDVNDYVSEFLIKARNVPPKQEKRAGDLVLIQDPEYKRLSAKVDLGLALDLYNIYYNDTFDEDSRLRKCAEEFKKTLDSLNGIVIEQLKSDLNTAIENVIAGIRYHWIQPDGPKFKEITIKTPLVYRYFTDHGEPKSLKEHEEIMYSERGAFLMAHNGWVMNSDPLKNFAAPDSKVYLRRELIAWGDSVKLRFGDRPEDCPFLWEHMRRYVEETARIFDGVRLDNCHSTPIPVAEYLLDCARKVKPNLYVVAELFTNSDMTDNIFVNRLGITSLIREAMSAWDSHEEGRLVYRYGGDPVGAFYQPSIRPLMPSIAHALFLDLTHDNPSPVEKRSVFDLLPSTALVNMACCASGSNRGYDELVPHHIHVVDELREYTEWWAEGEVPKGGRYVSEGSGIIGAKRALNEVHFLLGKEGFNQVYVDQMDPDVVAVTRHCPNTHQSYILVAFTSFYHPPEDSGTNQRYIRPLRFEGVLDEVVLEATLSHNSANRSDGAKFRKWKDFLRDPTYINGLSEYNVSVKQHISIKESDVFEQVDSGTCNVTQLNFKNFRQGSIVIIKTSLREEVIKAVKDVRNLIDSFSLTDQRELFGIISRMSLADLNRALFRCDKEERDEGYGFDTYNIPNFGFLVYAGLQGVITPLADIRPKNDLGHPLCANLRDGDWLIDYTWRRLKFDSGTRELGEWIEKNTLSLKKVPRYLIPCYFDAIATGIYLLLLQHSTTLMSDFVTKGSTFVRGLSLASMQMAAYIKSSNLPTLSPNLAPPRPPSRKNENGEDVQTCVTLSAGLPHFAVGYMRNWGRDTFIALRGCFILTGRYQEAREHILGYGQCLRHGLIPNLLDGGRNSRYNCRDAIWWWLQCIKEYVQEAPNGASILSDTVSRLFPQDDSVAQPPGEFDQPLHDVIQEALNVHFQGLAFRERNAGKQIDEHMHDVGFNNQIGIHPDTGFVFGGNQWNCGTWMDKMGSSDKAGNRGKPATPRDGSAVELVGLSKSVVTWLGRLHSEGRYPYPGVERTHKNGSKTEWTFSEWAEKIAKNFEKHFWVSGETQVELVNKKGIYKDSYGSSLPWTDFQLRCNFPIAMVVAPELFNPKHAWIALQQAETYLLGPLGMKTLDPEDWAYRGDYDNSNDSDDPTVAHGFNYHQGPEWVWPMGFFLRAKLHFAALNNCLAETVSNTKLILSRHFVELQTSPWRGLPELTNSKGSYCGDSCRTQAWSISCILEVLHDLQNIESKSQRVN